jgi:hypothetical protein
MMLNADKKKEQEQEKVKSLPTLRRKHTKENLLARVYVNQEI